MSDETGRLWEIWREGFTSRRSGVVKNMAGSLEPEPETVTGIPPISDTEENPFDPREHAPGDWVEFNPGLDRDQLAGEIYRDILNAYWPSFTDAGFNTFNDSGCSELFKACASCAVKAADALDEALRSE